MTFSEFFPAANSKSIAADQPGKNRCSKNEPVQSNPFISNTRTQPHLANYDAAQERRLWITGSGYSAKDCGRLIVRGLRKQKNHIDLQPLESSQAGYCTSVPNK